MCSWASTFSSGSLSEPFFVGSRMIQAASRTGQRFWKFSLHLCILMTAVHGTSYTISPQSLCPSEEAPLPIWAWSCRFHIHVSNTFFCLVEGPSLLLYTLTLTHNTFWSILFHSSHCRFGYTQQYNCVICTWRFASYCLYYSVKSRAVPAGIILLPYYYWAEPGTQLPCTVHQRSG